MTQNQTFQSILIVREVDAPRELVWEAWTKPEHLVQWYHASEDWTTPYAEVDVRPGGRIRIGFQSPNAEESFDLTGAYDEVRPPERLAFHLDDGRPVIVTLEDMGGKTRMTVDLSLETTHSAEMQREGWTAMFINLEAYLAGR